MKRWEILYNQDTSQIDLQTLTAILLQNRNLTEKEDIESFFHPTLDSLTLKDLKLKKSDIDAGKKLIEDQKKAEKTIIIYGDYDVDGICATAILWETLYATYKKTIPYIPHRVEEGYGLSVQGIDNVLEKYPDTGLIITVDNGVTAIEAIEYAKKKGIHVIVTDHHSKGDTISKPDVLIHTTKLCGAGVSYVFAKNIHKEESETDKHLELAAVATVADCMPLKAENRAVVKYGLDNLRKTERAGLLELFTDAKIDKNSLDVYHIGFMIAPRLNATGRLTSAMDSLRLVCTVDSMRAKVLAQKLAGANKDRQLLTTESFSHAKLTYANGDTSRVIVAADKTYNQGIIGLIASKLTESYYRPSIVIAVGENGVSKGSARSIKGVNIVSLLRSVSDHLVQVGGHEMAAGFTIETDKIELFTQAIQVASSQFIEDSHLERIVHADLEIPFSLITYELYKTLLQFAPFGIDNPEPSFITKNANIREIRTMGQDGKHLKLLLEQDGTFLEAVGFGFGTNFDKSIGDSIDILFTVGFDTWKGKNKIVLKIKDIH